jgi:hypothetical protein
MAASRVIDESALIMVGGHESAGGRGLPSLPLQGELAGVRPHVAAPGRELERALQAALLEGGPERSTVVLPMTLGRDPRLVSDAARTVRWAARGERPGAIVLAPPFGTADHLVSWLRGACLALHDEAAAVLIVATPANPFDDAELHRVAALVRTHGRRRLVEVCLRSHSGGIEEGLDRCRRLGAERVAVLPAEFDVAASADVAAPLLSSTVVARVVAARLATARHRLVEHEDDGVAAALMADHLHGFAHSHEGEQAHGHDHSHPHHHPRAAVG